MNRIPGSLRLLPLLISLGLTACGGGGGGGGGSGSAGGGPDTTAPVVTAVSPENKAVGVTGTSAINVTFSEKMKGDTINSTTMTVTANGQPVTGSVTYAGQTATFTPDNGLVGAGTTYSVTVKGSVQDLAGNALGQDYTWTFTTPAAASTGIARDSAGNLYVVGYTNTKLNSAATNKGLKDLFLTKYDTNGAAVWAMPLLIGTASDDEGAGVTVGADGSIYVAGTTNGALTGLPMAPGAAAVGVNDIFAAKVNAATGAVTWIQQLGTAVDDVATGIVADANGVYVSGYTAGVLGGNVTASAGGTDAVLVKLDPATGTKVAVTQFGSDKDDRGAAVAVDAAGGVYMTGAVGNFIIGVVDGAHGDNNADIFLAKYDTNLTRTWIHLRGTGENDLATGIAVDGNSVYIAGHTNCQLDGNINATGVGNAYDVFLVKYDLDGNWTWTKETGGTGSEFTTGVAVDGSGGIYVGGYTDGDLFGTANAGSSDLFVMKFDANPSTAPDGTADVPAWSVQKGTAASELAGGITVNNGTIYQSAASSSAATLTGAKLIGDGIFFMRYNTTDGNVIP